MNESFRVAGIDVHKKMLAVVIADVDDDEIRFIGRKFGAMDSDLKELSQWLADNQVLEAVMESTAQYWKPVWRNLEGQFRLHLAQAHSNRGPRGRKRDFQDAQRLVRRHLAGELILSFVPDAEQRMWRTLTRSKHQLIRDRVRLQNQLESLLEDARIKLSSWVSDLLGVSSRRILAAIAAGQQDPAGLASLAEPELRATQEQLIDALQATVALSDYHRQILGLLLERLDLLERHIAALKTTIASALKKHEQAVARLAAVPGFGIDSAEQVIAEVGPHAVTFACAAELSSWVGVCPGAEESAEVSKSSRSPKGNRVMRRVLNQVANAAVKTKGSVFQALYRRWVVRKGHNWAVWAVAHRICRLVWKILHQGVDYIEYGEQRDAVALQLKLTRMARQLRSVGYKVIPPPVPAAV